ncbi:MAG TPA: CoA transferase [Burkholderiales bacterium]|nr:CoA transferase [Burkholderiales bacterium]
MQNQGPLSGYRVLELGSTVAGPFCARLLADFGAEVVKIEAAEGDPVRQLSAAVNGKSLYAASILRNKRIASLDFRKAEARELVKRVIPKFDVVVENFRPGTLEKWGLGYEDLRRLHPGLVMTRVSGFGQTGPYRDQPGYGVIGEAKSGLRHMIGDPDRPPSRVGIPLTDYITGVYAAFGTMMALLVREKTGTGQCVDASLIESAFSYMEAHVPAYEKTGKIPKRTGARLADSAPNTLFPTRDGSHIHIAALADPVFRRLAAAIGRPELAADPRFAEQRARSANEELIEGIVAEWTSAHDLEEIEATLRKGDVPASRIYDIADIFRDPHYKARDMLVSVPDDELGSVTLAGVVPKLSVTPGRLRWSGRRVGQDTRAFLKDTAGLGDAEIDRLAAAGVIYCDPKS